MRTPEQRTYAKNFTGKSYCHKEQIKGLELGSKYYTCYV